MTFNPQETEAMTQNWEQVATQLQAQFPDMDKAQLQQAKSDPNQLVTKLAEQTGQPEDQIASQVRSIVSQFTPDSTS